ncbi:MAG: hypothetical protein NC218_04100 [Acetobacter sp.]|nr:hypothetical protein [Acetobacter sp.]
MTKTDEKILEKLNEACSNIYAAREVGLQNMKNLFSAKEIYLISVLLKMDDKNEACTEVYINTCDGLENNYKAKKNPELIRLIDRCMAENILPPPAIAFKSKYIGLMVSDMRQQEIVDEIFVQNGSYEWGYVATMCNG